MLIYKIFRAEEHRTFRDAGETLGAPIDLADGYIHFSTADQAPETAAKYFADVPGLVLLALDADTLGPALKWEPSRGGDLFPHLYRPLRSADVLWDTPLPWQNGAHVFPEEIAGHVDPARRQFDAFKSFDRDRPIDMLNLVRLRSRAAYPAGHPLAGDGLSGADAYARYGQETAPILARLGGQIVWRGGYETTLIGPASDRWDQMFVARYPDTHAFLAMVTDPDYQAAVVHRRAAVRTSRLIRSMPGEPGVRFG